MGEWVKTINEWGKTQKDDIKKVRKSFVFFLYSAIVKRTPVDTGRARSNWFISKGKVNASVTDKKSNRYNLGNVPDADGDEDYFISNNLPYIGTLEYGEYPDPVKKGTYDKKRKQWVKKSDNGFSKQAPHGMLGVTVAEADKIYDMAVKYVKRKGK